MSNKNQKTFAYEILRAKWTHGNSIWKQNTKEIIPDIILVGMAIVEELRGIKKAMQKLNGPIPIELTEEERDTIDSELRKQGIRP